MYLFLQVTFWVVVCIVWLAALFAAGIATVEANKVWQNVLAGIATVLILSFGIALLVHEMRVHDHPCADNQADVSKQAGKYRIHKCVDDSDLQQYFQ